MTSRTDSEHRSSGATTRGPAPQDPERWTLQIDEGRKPLCRQCPRRWQCARDACESPGAGGLGRHRDPGVGAPAHFRAAPVAGLAERNGYPVTLNPARYARRDRLARLTTGEARHRKVAGLVVGR